MSPRERCLISCDEPMRTVRVPVRCGPRTQTLQPRRTHRNANRDQLPNVDISVTVACIDQAFPAGVVLTFTARYTHPLKDQRQALVGSEALSVRAMRRASPIRWRACVTALLHVSSHNRHALECEGDPAALRRLRRMDAHAEESGDEGDGAVLADRALPGGQSCEGTFGDTVLTRTNEAAARPATAPAAVRGRQGNGHAVTGFPEVAVIVDWWAPTRSHSSPKVRGRVAPPLDDRGPGGRSGDETAAGPRVPDQASVFRLGAESILRLRNGRSRSEPEPSTG